MSRTPDSLASVLQTALGELLVSTGVALGEVTVEVAADNLLEVATRLREHDALCFEQLVDLCGVDYALYGRDEWQTEESTAEGFSRGVDEASSGRLLFGDQLADIDETRRFAVVVHLLSYRHNNRLRLRCYAAPGEMPVVPSLTGVWSSANWYEREAFDLFGILFEGHTDLRRLLTDYGFVGHPFRKDFPLVGHVEMRYDPERKRVVYEPVSIEPRVLVPRVIRRDHRYARPPGEETPTGDEV